MGRWLFVTAASADIGFGHVSRTQLLAKEAHRLGLQVDVITSPGSVPSDCASAGPQWHEAEMTPRALIELATRHPPPSVIVLDAPNDWIEPVSRTRTWTVDRDSSLIAVFRSDGLPKVEDSFEHVSLTPTFEMPSTTDVYGRAGRVRRWSGRDLIFVRPTTFLREPTVKDDPPKIIVTMGGADPHKITSQVCSALRDHPVPARVVVVVGRMNPDASAIESAFSTHFEILRQGAFDFDDLLKRASIAVVNAGLTRYECIAAQTPFVAISMNERQARFTELVVAQGFGAHAGVVGPASLTETSRTLREWLADPTKLEAMRRRGREMVNPSNATRFVQRLTTWARAHSNAARSPAVEPPREGRDPR